MATKPTFDPSMHLIHINRNNGSSKKPPSNPKQRKQKQYNNDWASQEDAFFGTKPKKPNTKMGSPKRENSVTRRDFELAQRLQNEMDQEDRKTEEKDLEFAKMIQNQEGEYAGTAATSRSSMSTISNDVSDMEHNLRGKYRDNGVTSSSSTINSEGTKNDEDLEMALLMQNLYSLGKGHFISSRNLSGNNLTLDEMRKLVKEAQEENTPDGIKEETKEEVTTTARADDAPRKRSTKQGEKVRNNFKKGLGTLLRRTGMDNLNPHHTKPNNATNKQGPICSVCNEPAKHYITALNKTYHPSCFRCVGCNKPIPSGEPFAYKTLENGDTVPLHRSCHSTLYGMKCTVCHESIPYSDNGAVSYIKHPFFTNELMCPIHANDPCLRRCTSCNRFEPIGSSRFVDLYDKDRCVCHACCRTVIVDSEEAKPLYKLVIRFFEHHLNLPIWDGMREIPVLIVASDVINSSSEHSGHRHSDQILTRGLCLSEHQCGRRIALQRLMYDRQSSSFRSKKGSFFDVPTTTATNINSSVTAILCVTGLPKDLTASILAHESTHAWIKLHPHFDASRRIPLQVEEGVCQLVAFLFLNDGLPPPSTTTDDGLSDQKLRQYFKFSIEADENEIYGDGFRKAANIYASIGLYELLNYIAIHGDFPKL